MPGQVRTRGRGHLPPNARGPPRRIKIGWIEHRIRRLDPRLDKNRRRVHDLHRVRLRPPREEQDGGNGEEYQSQGAHHVPDRLPESSIAASGRAQFTVDGRLGARCIRVRHRTIVPDTALWHIFTGLWHIWASAA